MSNLLALYSGDVSSSLHLHHYNVNNYNRDVILIINENGQLTYIVVDRIKEKIIESKSLPYLSKITNVLIKVFPELTVTALSLDKVLGMYDNKSTTAFELTTLFFVIKNNYLNTYYVVQMDIKNHNTKDTNLTLIQGHLNTKNEYLDLMIKNDAVYNDIQTKKTKQAFIMFVDVKNSISKSFANAHIKGLKLLVTNDEKNEFKNNFPDVEFLDTYHPIVDVWSNQQIVFMQLTEDSKKAKFNFSTGMGFVQFEEG